MRSPNECYNNFSRLQEEKIFGQLNPGNGIEKTSGSRTWDRQPALLLQSDDP
ncbi:MAG: hypothetical protein KME26_20435 [Oscillatoria princeps RMCB-10]|nr:hypothetical protein [Oscillatoria princeps RMCB-10]